MTHQGEFIYQKAEHCLIGRFQGLYPFGGGLFGDPIAHLFFSLSRETTLSISHCQLFGIPRIEGANSLLV